MPTRDRGNFMSRVKGRPSRRSFLRTVVGGAALSGATSIINGAPAQVRTWSANEAACASGVTDSDRGAEADPAGNGRGTGVTDSDSGESADRGGYGQGTGVSDEDSGETADRAGYGSGPRAVTDRDHGAHADPVGEGRGRERHTDTDVGFGSDPIGRGAGENRRRPGSYRPCRQEPAGTDEGDQ